MLVILTSIKNWSPFAQSSITVYSAAGLIQVAHATVQSIPPEYVVLESQLTDPSVAKPKKIVSPED